MRQSSLGIVESVVLSKLDKNQPLQKNPLGNRRRKSFEKALV
jgi:hypothetical protein